jgi:hypothetical protein
MMRMDNIIFSTYGQSPALQYARNALTGWGYTVSPDWKTATHLLLPVPSFDPDGNIKGGMPLPEVDPCVTILGGNMDGIGGKIVDFLKDEFYLYENAAITAECALQYAPIQAGTSVLVIGWGRIGKHLAPLLAGMGAQVTVAVRKENSWKDVAAQGFEPVYLQDLKPRKYDVVYNTAPASVLFSGECREDAVLVDLASKTGIFGKGVIYARGLPGKDAPEASGILIAKTALRYVLTKEANV